MATIQRRKNADGTVSYRAMVRKRGFPHVSETFSSKTRAEAWAKRIEVSLEEGHIPSTAASRTTLREALQRYLDNPPKKKNGQPLKGWKRQQDRVKTWMQHKLALRFLSQLRGQDFADYRDGRRAEGKAENTIRIELALISVVYKLAAQEWGMEGLRNPLENVSKPGTSNQRSRRLVGDEESRLLAQLEKAGPYMRPLAELAIETAMRQGELLALTWADVSLSQRVAKLRDTKNSEPRDVPLSTRAVEILKALPRPLDPASKVFPLSQDHVIRTFRQACTDTGIKDLKFHDLRHEATSRICGKLPMHEVMRITGHKTPSMLLRYYHPEAEELARKLG